MNVKSDNPGVTRDWKSNPSLPVNVVRVSADKHGWANTRRW